MHREETWIKNETVVGQGPAVFEEHVEVAVVEWAAELRDLQGSIEREVPVDDRKVVDAATGIRVAHCQFELEGRSRTQVQRPHGERSEAVAWREGATRDIDRIERAGATEGAACVHHGEADDGPGDEERASVHLGPVR